MSYFDNFPAVYYQFGSNGAVLGQQAFQDLTAYTDVLDQVADNVTAFSFYNILEGDRPDVLSQKFYGRPDLHWTFFLVNDHIRESGWPLDRNAFEAWLVEKYTGVAVTTRTDVWGTVADNSNVVGPSIRIGQTLTGSISGVSATVTKVDPDNGQVFLNGSSLYNAGEAATWRDADNVLRTLTVASSTTKPNAIDHFEDGDGEVVDIDPTVGGGINAEVTIRDMAVRRNDALREINVIRPEYIEQIATAFENAINS